MLNFNQVKQSRSLRVSSSQKIRERQSSAEAAFLEIKEVTAGLETRITHPMTMKNWETPDHNITIGPNWHARSGELGL